MAPRQSSLRAFQYIAKAFEVAGYRRGSGTRRGHPPPRCYGGWVGWEALLILLLISSRPIPRRADVGGSERRRKKDLRGGGADRPRSRRTRGRRGGGGEPYLFECVVARDKNDGESLKSMWRSTATNSTSTPSSTLGGIANTRHVRARARRPTWICVCEREKDKDSERLRDDIYVSIDWVPAPSTARGYFDSRGVKRTEKVVKLQCFKK